MATSCDLKAPRCTTVAPPVRLHGPRGGVFVGHRPPRDPGDPRLIYIYIWWKSETKFYVYSDVPHTHPAPSRACFRQMRWKWGWQEMKVKWAWKWDESYLTRTQDGDFTKRRGTKREHQHQHTLPGAGEPWKGKGKEKAEADGRTPRQAEGGEDGSAWTNLNPSENKTYLSTHGPEPTWNGGARMK